ncbi:hypothetical protein JCM16358_22320 [Halanaerocella petrolearia]
MIYTSDYQKETGFTLVEVVVGITILSLVLIPILGSFIGGFQMITDTNKKTQALSLARWAIESVKGCASNSDQFTISEIIDKLKNLQGVTIKQELSNALLIVDPKQSEFEIKIELVNQAGPTLKQVTVTVFWLDKRGDKEEVKLMTLLTNR